jgi:hypothetical protein
MRGRWTRTVVALSLAFAGLVTSQWVGQGGADTPGEGAPAVADGGEGYGDEEAEGVEPIEGEEEGRGEAEELRARDQWFYGQRAFPNKRVQPNLLRRAVRQQRMAAGRVGIQVAADLPLVELGPHPINEYAPDQAGWNVYGGVMPLAGRITSITTDPVDQRVAFIGSANGGVWRTRDDGVTWTPVFDAKPSLAIGALAIDPANSRTIYAGTGEANGCCGSYFGLGLFKSSDGGDLWSKLGGTKFDNCVFSSVVIKPGSSSTIFVGVHGHGKYSTACPAGVYRTTNGGANGIDWVRVSTGDPSDIVIPPNAPSVVYAAFLGFGIYRSTQSGDSGTWAKVQDSDFPATSQSVNERVDLTVAAAGGLSTAYVVYAVMSTSTGGLAGIFASYDSGGTWKKLGASTSFCASASGQCDYDIAIAVDPSSPGRFFAAGVRLYRYVQESWSLMGDYKIHWDNHALAFDAAGRLWVGNDGGIYRLNDVTGDTTWKNLNGDLGITQFYPGISGSFAGPLVGGEQDNGSSKYTGTKKWRFIGPGDGGYAVVNPSNPNLIFVTLYDTQIRKIVNGTTCPYLETTGITRDRSFTYPLVGDPSRPNVLYVGLQNGSIYKSTTGSSTVCGGTTWSLFNSPFTYVGSDGKTYYDQVMSIAPSKSDSARVYAGTWAGRIYVHTSTGWASASSGLPGRSVTDIWVSPTNANVAYAAVSGFASSTTIQGHVFKTTNGGGSWANVSGAGLPDAPTSAITVDPRQNAAVIYAGTDLGVYWSNDDGGTWQNTSTGLPKAVVVTDLLLDTPADRLIVGTFGRGMWAGTPIGSTPSGPANDNFAGATVIGSLPYTQTGVSNVGATTEGSEPAPPTSPSCTDGIGATVWYRYTAAQTGSVVVDTQGSIDAQSVPLDTVVTVHTGASLGALTEVPNGCSDDAYGQGSPSKATFNATSGTTYYIRVGGYKDPSTGAIAKGNISVKVSAGPPANDNFAGATVIGSLPYTQTGVSNVDATTQASEPSNTCAPMGNTVWFRITPSSSGTVTASTAGSGFDTVLAVWTGASLTTLTQVTCDDDGVSSGGPSQKSFSVSAGTTYYIQVGGWKDTTTGKVYTGSISFSLS